MTIPFPSSGRADDREPADQDQVEPLVFSERACEAGGGLLGVGLAQRAHPAGAGEAFELEWPATTEAAAFSRRMVLGMSGRARAAA